MNDTGEATGSRHGPIADLISELPPVLRAALSFAQAPLRGPFASIFALDQQLARSVAGRSEPLAAQIRLAWWRDELGKTSLQAAATPALPILANWPAAGEDLAAAVDGWEELLAEPPDYTAFASGRAAPFLALAGLLGCSPSQVEAIRTAALRWALVDLAGHLSSLPEAEAVLHLAAQLPEAPGTCPRSFRPLAVLDGLARRALRRGGGLLMGDRLSPLSAIRLGILGR